MKLLFFVFSFISSVCVTAQIDKCKIKYFKKEKALGVIHKETKEIIIQPMYQKINFFYQNDTLTNLLAVATKDDNQKYNSYLINLNGERVSNYSTQLIFQSNGTFNYRQYRTYGRTYKIDTNCLCIPKDYYPCPNRVPMNLTSISNTQKNIQKLEWIFEFKGIDSTFTAVDNLLLAYPTEPQYYFYKAWLLQSGFETQQFRIDYYGYNYYDEYDTDYFQTFPIKFWTPYLSEDSNIIQQKKNMENTIDQIDYNWEDQNEMYDTVNINVNDMYELLEKVKELEKSNQDILLQVNCWQHELIKLKQLSLIKRLKAIYQSEQMIKRINPNHYPSKYGFVMTPFYLFGKSPSYGVRFGFGHSQKKNKLFNNFFVKWQLGFSKFQNDPELNAISTNLSVSSSNISFGSGSRRSWMRRGKKVTNINIDHNLSLLVKKDGYTALAYTPQIGLHFWNFTFNVGYNFVNKKKYPEQKGPVASVNLSTFLVKEKVYSYKYSIATNLFE